MTEQTDDYEMPYYRARAQAQSELEEYLEEYSHRLSFEQGAMVETAITRVAVDLSESDVDDATHYLRARNAAEMLDDLLQTHGHDLTWNEGKPLRDVRDDLQELDDPEGE